MLVYTVAKLLCPSPYSALLFQYTSVENTIMTIKDGHAVYGQQRWIERKMRLLTESITDAFVREGLLVQWVRIISHLEDTIFLSICARSIANFIFSIPYFQTYYLYWTLLTTTLQRHRKGWGKEAMLKRICQSFGVNLLIRLLSMSIRWKSVMCLESLLNSY